MGFNKDTARQAGSRSSRKGTPNRATNDLRQVVADLLEENTEAIAKDIQALEPAARVAAWIKLLEFALPKLNRTQSEHTGPDGGAIQICSIHFVDDRNDAQALGAITTTQTPQVQPQAPLAQEAVLIAVANGDNRKGSNPPPQAKAEPESDVWY